MSKLTLLPQHQGHTVGEENGTEAGETTSPDLYSPASSPDTVVGAASSRNASPTSSLSQVSTRFSAFSLVYPKELSGIRAFYANSMRPLVSSLYRPYIWHPVPGLFLPYSPTCSPDPVQADQSLIPGNFTSDKDVPLNLSLKGRSRTHSIWSPGSLCEQEMKNVEVKPDSSIAGTIISRIKTNGNRWKWDNERDLQNKVPTIGPSGEKQFKIRLMSY